MDVRVVAGVTRAYQEQQINAASKNSGKKVQLPEQKDEVVLSSQAIEYTNTLKSLKNTSEIREAKIMELSEKIASGTYSVSADKIAGSIITYSKYK